MVEVVLKVVVLYIVRLGVIVFEGVYYGFLVGMFGVCGIEKFWLLFSLFLVEGLIIFVFYLCAEGGGVFGFVYSVEYVLLLIKVRIDLIEGVFIGVVLVELI